VEHGATMQIGEWTRMAIGHGLRRQSADDAATMGVAVVVKETRYLVKDGVAHAG
jgi:hypothetical protein